MKVFKSIALTLLFMIAGISTGAHAEVTTHPYPGWDAPGNDVDSFPSGNQANCSQICKERGNCSAAVFNTATKRCWVKSAAPTFNRAADGVLLLKILTARDGIDYPGGDYHSYQATNWQACSRSCFVSNQCRAFTFDKNTSTCWLKNAIVDAAFVPNGISGRK